MHLNIFDNNAFSGVSMTEGMEDYDFTPDLIGSMNLFETIPVRTTDVSVERRGNTLSLIPTTPRGSPPVEGNRDGRNLRKFSTTRIAKGHTLMAAEIQDVRAFGSTSELETMQEYVGRYLQRLITDVEVTWENMMLGAVQGTVLDADGSVLIDWFSEWEITRPAEINFALDDAATQVEQKCRDLARAMARNSKGSITSGTRIIGLAGDEFFDRLTRHKSVKENYLGTPEALQLGRGFGVASQSPFDAGSFATFEYGGITFVNYRSGDSFEDDGIEAGTSLGTAMVGIPSTKCKFFPQGARGVFQQAFAPGESWEFVNTLGRPLYAEILRDEKRNWWVRPEVYSYPLFICARPDVLFSARA